ncbi:MAG TPA: response regulator, partial [Vicinamibacterales bacterium]
MDDDRDTRELYRLVFEMAGCRVSEADSVADGRSLATLVKPDVVLTDWRLADGTALELCSLLHHQVATRLVPIVAATGMSLSAGEVERVRALGCRDVLTKPVDLDALIATVTRAFAAKTSRRLRAATLRAGRFVARTRRELADEAEMASLMVQHASRHGNGDVALIVANDKGHYVAANERASSLTGYEPQELTRLSVWDITPMPKTAQVEELWKGFIAAGNQEGRYTVLRRDGAPVDAQYVAIANIAPGLHLSALS